MTNDMPSKINPDYFKIGSFYQIHATDLPEALKKEFPYGTTLKILGLEKDSLYLRVLFSRTETEYSIELRNIQFFWPIKSPTPYKATALDTPFTFKKLG
jgi:hypothetical protein